MVWSVYFTDEANEVLLRIRDRRIRKLLFTTGHFFVCALIAPNLAR